MRVLYLCDFFLGYLPFIPVHHRIRQSHPGNWIVNTISLFKKTHREAECFVCSISNHISKDFSVIQSGIEYTFIRNRSNLPFLLREWIKISHLYGFEKNKIRIQQEIERIKPDIIHVFGTENPIFGLSAVEIHPRAAIFIQGIINELHPEKTNDSRIEKIKLREKEIFSRAPFFLAENEFSASFARKQNPDAAFFRFRNPIQEYFFEIERKTAAPKTLLFLGSIVERKGIPILLRAIEKLDVTLHIVGDGNHSYVTALKEMSKNSTAAIHWHGKKTSSEIISFFRNAGILVHPTLMDSNPNAVAEAQCAGVPVIASNVGGMPYMIEDGVTGRLFPVGDSNALREVILDSLNNYDAMQEMAARAKEMALKEYYPDRVAENLYSIYQKIIAD